MRFYNVVIGIGFLMFVLGGSAADSPGDAHLYAAGLTLLGLLIAWVGFGMENKHKRKRRWDYND